MIVFRRCGVAQLASAGGRCFSGCARVCNEKAVVKPIDLIKRIRAETNVPLNVAKTAVDQSDNTFSSAMYILRQEMAKRSDKVREKVKDRPVNQGWIASAQSPGIDTTLNALKEPKTLLMVKALEAGRAAAMVELGCETDFVAGSPVFQDLARWIALSCALQSSPISRQINRVDPQTVLSYKYLGATEDAGTLVEDEIKNAIGLLGENIQVKRVLVGNGNIAIRQHGAPSGAEDSILGKCTVLGRMAALVYIKGDESIDTKFFQALTKSLLLNAPESQDEYRAIYDIHEQEFKSQHIGYENLTMFRWERGS